MSCLELKKLLPHRKVWKMITKLPLKLMMRSKPNKKHKNRSHKTSKKKLTLPSLSMQPKKFKKRPNSHTLIHRKNHHRCFQKRAPVFVDHLFVEPVSVVREHVAIKEKSPSLKGSEILDGESNRPESSKNGSDDNRPEVDDQSMVSADDVWESMVLASPQMHEINERADEFIARFRAQMNHQEMMARRS